MDRNNQDCDFICTQESYDNLETPEDKRQVLMVQDTLKLGGDILSKIPDMLAAQLVGRLLPEMWRASHLEKLIRECDQKSASHNALLPVCHCLLSPGGPMKFSLEVSHLLCSMYNVQINQKKYFCRATVSPYSGTV